VHHRRGLPGQKEEHDTAENPHSFASCRCPALVHFLTSASATAIQEKPRCQTGNHPVHSSLRSSHDLARLPTACMRASISNRFPYLIGKV
jgi:hypothetical protein